ncbi:MAG: hypothetical protein HFI75_06410 [Lachnospiraceae bacterium]|nr:hypothetical protein [Lachnospiraceae bacterium]
MAVNLEDKYKQLLRGKKIPLLVLDNKWHQLFLVEKKNRTIKKLEAELNQLLQRQGKLGTDIKDMKKIKSGLLQEIQENMEEAEKSSKVQKKQEKNQRMIVEINDKTNAYEAELEDIPDKLEEVNEQLMLETMNVFYNLMKKNDERIEEIVTWVKEIREQVKDNMVQKTTLEEYNTTIYGYLHDVLGADVVNIFDLKYLKKQENDGD